MKNSKSASVHVFVVFAVFVVLYHFFAYFGHYGYDDMGYAKNAINLLNGTPDFNDSFSHRITIVCFTALSYF